MATNIGVTGVKSDGTISVSGVAGAQQITATGTVAQKGDTGATGATGAAGINGTNGQGVPTGGTANQVLAKIDSTNYNTQWIPQSTNSSSVTKTVGPSNADYITTGASSGTTDDSQIQAACAAVIASGGGTVYIQPKSTPYNITRRIIVLGSNLLIKGGGQGATYLKLANNVDQEIFVVGNGHSDDPTAGDSGTVIPNNFVWFEDLTVDGNKANQTAASSWTGGARYAPSATRNLIRFRSDAQTSYGGGCRRVTALNGMQNGLSCESQAQGSFTECTAENMEQNGMWVENGSDWVVENCYTRNNGQDTTIGGYGIKFASFGGFVVSGNSLKGDKGGGIGIQSSGMGTIVGNSVYRPGWQAGVGDYAATGIMASLCDNLAISGNSIYASQGHGLLLNGNTSTAVVGNTFRRNGQYANNTYADIWLTYAGGGDVNRRCSFIGNTFENDTATFFTNKTAYNIGVYQSASGHAGNTFIGNTFHTPGTAVVDSGLLATNNTWGPHDYLNPQGVFSYGYLSNPTQTINPKDGNVLVGTGYNSTVAVTISNGIAAGQQFTFIFNQDVGNKQLTWAANVKFQGGLAPVFSGIANSQDSILFTWDGTNWNGDAYVKRNGYTYYGYFVTSGTQNINPSVDGEVIYGVGYQSTTPVTITNGTFSGQQFTLLFNQDSGNKQITWGANVRWAGGTAPNFIGTASTIDVINFTWDSTNSKWNATWAANQATLNLKASLASPALTGTPTAPTASPSTNSTQIATTAYTDAAVAAMSAGLSWKASVRAATTVTGTLASAYANGSVVDGVTLATGDRILLKNQTTGSENGIYVVAASGAPARSSDANSSTTLVNNTAVFVREGTANQDTGWTLTNDGTITLGSTALVFAQFTGASTAAATPSSLGTIELNTDLGGTATAPQVVATHLASALPVLQGGTGSTIQNFVDLSSTQASIGGAKTFTSPVAITPTTNPGLAVGTTGAGGYIKLGDATLRKAPSNFFSMNGDGFQGIWQLMIGQDSPDTSKPLLVINQGSSGLTTSSVVSTFRGMAGQTGDLAQWQNSSPATVAKVDINGGITGTSFSTSYVAKTANYTATASDSIIDCTANSFTVTLPTAVGLTGRQYIIKNSGSGVITVATTSSQTIDGSLTASLAIQYVSLTVVSNGTNWIVI